MAIKQSTATWVPIRLVDASDVPVTGLAFASLAAGAVFKLCKNGAAGVTFTVPSSGAWLEDGDGYYNVLLAAGDCDTLGLIGLTAKTTAGQPWKWVDRVEANLVVDAYTRLGAPAGASHAADVAAVKVDTAAILVRTDVATSTRLATSGYTAPDNTGISTINTRLGAPAGASHAADIAAVKTDTAGINTKLGTPAGASVSADIAAIKSDTGASGASLTEILASVGKHNVRDQLVYNGDGDLTGARIRAYDTAAHAVSAGATGLLFTWTIVATYSAPAKLATYTMTQG